MRIGLVVATLVACHDPPRSPVETAQGPPPRVARPFPANAPPRDACHIHADCGMIVWDGPVGSDPCCDVRVGYMPVARVYLDFMATYRKANCAGVTCPTPPLPGAEPACCANIPRCVAQHCVSACDDPTAHPPKVSVLDGMCNPALPDAAEPCNAAAIPKAYRAGSPAYSALGKCCASLRANAPLLQYGTPSELTEAADMCDESVARLANECAPTKLAELKRALKGKGVPDCKLP